MTDEELAEEIRIQAAKLTTLVELARKRRLRVDVSVDSETFMDMRQGEIVVTNVIAKIYRSI